MMGSLLKAMAHEELGEGVLLSMLCADFIILHQALLSAAMHPKCDSEMKYVIRLSTAVWLSDTSCDLVQVVFPEYFQVVSAVSS